MKYSKGQFTNEYYQLWSMGLLLPIPENSSVFSVKFRKNHFDEYSKITLKATSVNDALERACFALTYSSPWTPEEIDLHAVYDSEENLLWMDEPYYQLVQRKYEFRGMERREFLKRFGMTSAAILYGLQPSVAHGIIPFGFVKKGVCINTPGGTHIIGASGSSTYTTPGTYKWCVPTDVTSVCVVCVGAGGGGGAAYWAGGGGGGGGLVFKNSLSVSPGQSYSILVGTGGTSTIQTLGGQGSTGGSSTISGNGINFGASGGAGGTGDGASNANLPYAGGNGGSFVGSGFTISNSGGSGGTSNADTAGGGGGGGNNGGNNSLTGSAQSGGGVGIYGLGTSGNPGMGGSGGGNGSLNLTEGGSNNTGGFYGGGGGGQSNDLKSTPGCHGGGGAVRIIWGTGRSFPSNAL